VWYSSVSAQASATSLIAQGLNPDTTYYLRAGAIWGNTTDYAYTSRLRPRRWPLRRRRRRSRRCT
jgi:hypothetical protein